MSTLSLADNAANNTADVTASSHVNEGILPFGKRQIYAGYVICCSISVSWTVQPIIGSLLPPVDQSSSHHSLAVTNPLFILQTFLSTREAQIAQHNDDADSRISSPSWRIRWHYNLKWSKSVTFFSSNHIKAQVSGRKFMSPPHVHPIKPNTHWQWKTQSQVLFFPAKKHTNNSVFPFVLLSFSTSLTLSPNYFNFMFTELF